MHRSSSFKLPVPQLVKKFPTLQRTRRFITTHDSSSLVPIQNQINQIHAFLPQFSKIHFNIILPPTPKSSKWSLSFKFRYQKAACIFLPSLHVTYCTRFNYFIWWLP